MISTTELPCPRTRVTKFGFSWPPGSFSSPVSVPQPCGTKMKRGTPRAPGDDAPRRLGRADVQRPSISRKTAAHVLDHDRRFPPLRRERTRRPLLLGGLRHGDGAFDLSPGTETLQRSHRLLGRNNHRVVDHFHRFRTCRDRRCRARLPHHRRGVVFCDNKGRGERGKWREEKTGIRHK